MATAATRLCWLLTVVTACATLQRQVSVLTADSVRHSLGKPRNRRTVHVNACLDWTQLALVLAVFLVTVRSLSCQGRCFVFQHVHVTEKKKI
jgi:hypothetical protein